MKRDTVIQAEHVSKKYSKSLKKSMLYGIEDIGRNLLGMRSRSGVLRPGEFWSVDDVSFEVKRGETLGLIGPNGSGKTTLLKMLNGIFWPDRGRIRVKGRVGALIAVGAGFHPLLTGRENIYVNGAILGMDRKEVGRKFDSIVEFADIGDFLDTPVKHYSSGMFVRLGFSVAVHCEPDILLVDEVLAVGDTDFQSKCYRRIAELMKKGVVIVLVAHNMETIRHMCGKALFLWKGRVREMGDSDSVVLSYLRLVQQEQVRKAREEKGERSRTAPGRGKGGRIVGVEFLDEHDNRTNALTTGSPLRVRMEYEAAGEIENPVFAIHLYAGGALYASFIGDSRSALPARIEGRGAVELIVPQLHLPAGVYAVSAVLSREVEYNHIDWHSQEYFLQVGKKENSIGLVALPHRWSPAALQAAPEAIRTGGAG
ncbi:MAG: ABC transporter ATP-binding protein [Thermodesulfovibrionales bacterium]